MTTPANWRERLPRGVTDPCGPNGEPITTPTDRRLLWHIENTLAVCAPMGSLLDELRRDLTAYLNETCEHHWREYEASKWQDPDTGEVRDTIPAHRQCLWCHTVEWLVPQPEGGA